MLVDGKKYLYKMNSDICSPNTKDGEEVEKSSDLNRHNKRVIANIVSSECGVADKIMFDV